MKRRLLILFLGLVSFLGISQNTLEYSRHLTIANNLSHNGVSTIFEDSRGFIWIGTFDGLNKYDGYEFTVYKNTANQNILPSNRIRSIIEDKDGNLCIGTDDGISVYNYNSNSFKTSLSDTKNISKISSSSITDLERIHNKIVAVSDGKYIIILSDDYKSSRQISLLTAKDEHTLNNALKLDENTILFSSTKGLILYDFKKGNHYPVLSDQIANNNAIFWGKENSFFVALPTGLSLVSYRKSSDKFEFKLVNKHLMNEEIQTGFVDNQENIWLGTPSDGILHINNYTKLISNKPITVKRFNESSLGTRVSCLLSESQKKNCWVGTYNSGLYKFNIKEKPFRSFNETFGSDLGMNVNYLQSFSVFDEKVAIITTAKSGLHAIDLESSKEIKVPFTIPAFQKQYVRYAYKDKRNRIWVFLYNQRGIYRISDGKTELMKLHNINDEPVNLSLLRAVAEDSYGNLWFTLRNQVYKLNLDSSGNFGAVESLLHHPKLSSLKKIFCKQLYFDPVYNFLWIATENDGLIRLSQNSDTQIIKSDLTWFKKSLHRPDGINSDFVTCVLRGPDSVLWVGTERGGISKVLNSEKSVPFFIPITSGNGLSNDVVKSMQFDDSGKLWISTNIGLNRYDTASGDFHVFREDDGLPFEDFWYISTKTKNGTMVFSGITDFCSFDPNQLNLKENLPRLQVDELRLLNKQIIPGDTVHKRILIDKPVSDLDQLTLKHNENVFSIRANSLHYSNPENHFLQYKLTPLNDQWIKVPSNQRVMHFNGLRPGEYQLIVRASNSSNQWTPPYKLYIKILRPFWTTTPAFILYLLFISIIIYTIIMYYGRMHKLRHKLEIEQIEKDNVKIVNEAKLRFFSNISHEMKTPLTLLSGPLEVMVDRYKANRELSEKLNIIKRQAKKIYQLVNQANDFQRAEANKLKMNYSVFSFNHFINKLKPDFEFIALKEKKSFHIEQEKEQIFVNADKDKFEKIINNLLSNAFKFTDVNDTIELKYYAEENDLVLIIQDSGQGIDPEDLPNIFERFYQSKKGGQEFSGGSGIGLAFSKRLVDMHNGSISVDSNPGTGSNFKLTLPVVTHTPPKNHESLEEQILSLEESSHQTHAFSETVDLSKIKRNTSLSGASLFYVEDNAELNAFVTDVLKNFFHVRSFQNGEECLIALEKKWPDLIISDILMPKMNGLQLCKTVKTDLKTSHIPIILLTACISLEKQVEGLEMGADAYISKPFNMQLLIANIENLLDSRQKLRERYRVDIPLTLENTSNIHDINFLETLYSYIDENLENADLDVDACARACYLNRTFFYQKVKALTNQTPLDIIKSYRLKRSAELLREGDLTVNDVFSLTGFKNRSTFSRLFKKQYDIAPSEYAKQS